LSICYLVRLSIGINNRIGQHTHTTALQPSWILSGTTRVNWHQKGKTRKVKPIWFYWSKR